MKLMNKVAVVTGGASGMGEAICRRFAKEGAKVVVADYNFEGAQKVANEINAETLDAATALKADVSLEHDTNAMIDTAIALYGKLDILVNNAGIMDGFEPVGEVTNDRWDKVFAVNVNGPMYASRRAIALFLEQGSGNIINIASIGGLHGGRAGVAYVASKHAVIGLTKNTAFMYAKKGIRCNAIAPGAVATNIAQSMGTVSTFGQETTGVGMAINPAFGMPDQIASVALFLASDDSSFVNGAVVTADGGWTSY
ncbi:NAD(P)-dependent dehydrogenase (short-subunit alcohol dehydrogenase family) [Trichococcus patagoniensis]|uniref:NAD(P)-dependent dehydrogenase (Short-subunit alcohol dehydrogenase family) n=1 Tax=Trichococcus patagoniensis TaxID=382641 RepID=A0A2T5IQG4_9LACT|nr:SDR family oxidoreductase [Trichococcus patagoniensis]PTQ86053.1 NAD(P)-dependent dehydrogenase (short-subunit alcohol dehydrogenase family) [Trichococcus patagoniensis]